MKPQHVAQALGLSWEQLNVQQREYLEWFTFRMFVRKQKGIVKATWRGRPICIAP